VARITQKYFILSKKIRVVVSAVEHNRAAHGHPTLPIAKRINASMIVVNRLWQPETADQSVRKRGRTGTATSSNNDESGVCVWHVYCGDFIIVYIHEIFVYKYNILYTFLKLLNVSIGSAIGSAIGSDWRSGKNNSI
jgi:hypothetical protein